MANSYSAPNFDLDTSTNVAGLTALKGSAPSAGDKIYLYNGATLTIESDLACLLITLGDKASGAASAGQKYGILTVNAGVTVTWDGNATTTSSGIKMSPTTPAASSLGCQLNINGTVAAPVVFTNSVGANNTANKWTISATYGTVTATNWNAYYWYARLFTAMTFNSAYQNSAHSIISIDLGVVGLTSANMATTTDATIDMVTIFDGITVNVPTALVFNLFLWQGTNNYPAGTGYFRVYNLKQYGLGKITTNLQSPTNGTNPIYHGWYIATINKVIATIYSFTPGSGSSGDAIAILVKDVYSRTVSTVTINGQATTITGQTPSGNDTTVNVTAPAGLVEGDNVVVVTLSDASTARGTWCEDADYPATADVRDGTSYASGTLEGGYVPAKITSATPSFGAVGASVVFAISNLTGRTVSTCSIGTITAQDASSVTVTITSAGAALFTLSDGITLPWYWLNETDRNTDPGEGNVLNTTPYKILNVDKTGSYTAPVGEFTVSVLTITVIDGDSAPVQGARVQIRGSGGVGHVTSGVTASDGAIALTVLDDDYTIFIQRAEYQPDSIPFSVTVLGDTTTTCTMTADVPVVPAAGFQTVYDTILRGDGSAAVGAVLLFQVASKISTGSDGTILTRRKVTETLDSNGQFSTPLAIGVTYSVSCLDEEIESLPTRITITADASKTLKSYIGG